MRAKSVTVVEVRQRDEAFPRTTGFTQVDVFVPGQACCCVRDLRDDGGAGSGGTRDEAAALFMFPLPPALDAEQEAWVRSEDGLCYAHVVARGLQLDDEAEAEAEAKAEDIPAPVLNLLASPPVPPPPPPPPPRGAQQQEVAADVATVAKIKGEKRVLRVGVRQLAFRVAKPWHVEDPSASAKNDDDDENDDVDNDDEGDNGVEEGKTFQLSVSFRDQPAKHVYATGRSRRISRATTFTTVSPTLQATMIRVNHLMSRVVDVDVDGPGYREGVRVGDILIQDDGHGTREWRRLEQRLVSFAKDDDDGDNTASAPAYVEFDLDDMGNDDDDVMLMLLNHDPEKQQEQEEHSQHTTKSTGKREDILTCSLRMRPALDSVCNSELEPLEILFGTDAILEADGVGNMQLAFDRVGDAQVSGSVPFRFLSRNYVQACSSRDIELSVATCPVSDNDIVARRFSLDASLGVSLMTMSPVTAEYEDVSLISITHLSMHLEDFANGTTKMFDASCLWFQVDDQTPNATFPVVMSPIGSGSRGMVQQQLHEDAPALKLSFVVDVKDAKQRGGGGALHVRSFETFVQETSLKLHESFLLALLTLSQEYFPAPPPGSSSSTPSSTLPQAVRHAQSSSSSSLHSSGNSSTTNMATTTNPANEAPPPPIYRVFLDSADFKPMRFDITFSSASSSSPASSPSTVASIKDEGKKKTIRSLPFVSALVTAVASISDAPLRLGAVQLKSEVKTMDELLFAVRRHYTQEIMRGLFAIAGSTDILGSPVNLLQSFSKGAFSFFYEPALALSMGGYTEFGHGLKKGGSQLVSLAAGGVFDSLSKMCKALARSLANIGPDRAFVNYLEYQLKTGSVNEPINAREGVSTALLLVLRCVLDALVGFSATTDFQQPRAGLSPSQLGLRRRRRPWRQRIPEALLNALLKPAAGFFAALSQFAVGIRNTLTPVQGIPAGIFPVRMSRPRESKVLTYSASRAAGYYLARSRLGVDAKFVASEVCQVETATELVVTSLVITHDWVVACRESALDQWALPIALLRAVPVAAAAAHPQLVLDVLGMQYTCNCQNQESFTILMEAIEFAKRARGGKVNTTECFAETMRRKPLANPSVWWWDAPSMRLRMLERRNSIVDGSELDVVGITVASATIQSVGAWEDGLVRYRVKLVSKDGRAEWVVQRRYSDFLDFRDRACRFLSVSRKFLPLPGKRPWSLSPTELEARRTGLQQMLNRLLQIDLLLESEILREFLTRGADSVVIHRLQ